MEAEYPDEISKYEEDLEADSIDNWIRPKLATIKMINDQIDFLEYGDRAVRNNEIFIPAVNMGPGHYSDTGHRFRFNRFDRQDGWFFPDPDVDPFYDYIFYSSDTFPTPPVGYESLIVEMYFRLQVDQLTHSREVYNFMSFIGDLGGVQGILLQICGWVIGGYASFHSIFSTVSALYFFKSSNEPIF